MHSDLPVREAISTVPDEVVAALAAARRPIMISHVVPDADALGSSLAMALAFTRDSCQPKVSLPDGSLSQKLAFLADLAGVPLALAEDFAGADLFVTLDTAKLDRCNIVKEFKQTDWPVGRTLLNIDHHVGNTRYGSINWIEDHASSTCELVHRVLRASGRPITPTIASLIYAGIQTDTLGFSLPSTTPSSMRAAADLIEFGADVGELGERLCRSQRKSEFDLHRVIYANTRVVGNGEVAYSSASYDEIHDAGCTAADIDDQINIPRSLDGVRLAMLFTEGRKGKTRINFRSSGAVTVTELAAEFGGGGHSQAAGAVLDCGLTEAVQKVVPRAAEYVSKWPNPA